MLRDSDLVPLEHPKIRAVRKWVESLIIIGSLGLGGGGIGFWMGGVQARQDCAVEIERLRSVYESRVDNLAGKVSDAAETAASAAVKAESAAQAVKEKP
jgi:hypothetical protein